MINQQPSRRDATASGSSEGVGSADGAGAVLQLPLVPPFAAIRPKGLTRDVRAVDE